MAKVTQIDYQNALYDIEDADAQSKISDLQTAMTNTYTKTQVDTKFDNYYDKTQSDNRFVHSSPSGTPIEFVMQSTSQNLRSFSNNKSGICQLYIKGGSASSRSTGTVLLNGKRYTFYYVDGEASANIFVPYKANDVISITLYVQYGTVANINAYFTPNE